MNKTKKIETVARISTGVPRLDLLLKGGLFEGGLYIIQGPPGMGKTILANQICFEQAKKSKQAIYISLLAESTGRMVAYLKPLSFIDEDMIGTHVHYMSSYRILKDEGVSSLNEMIKTTIKENKAQLIVIDGIDNVASKTKTDADYREFLHSLQIYSALVNCTLVLLTPTAANADSRVSSEHVVSDGIIELSERQFGPRTVREIQILKLRGSNYLKGRHEIEVTSDGVIIHPRTEIMYGDPLEGNYTEKRSRMEFGIPRFDEMLHGGLLSGSMTTVIGAPGTGKTTLGLSFLAAGAIRGEHGIYFGFYETPPRLIEKARLLGLEIEDFVDKGLIELKWQQSVENIVDALAERLLERIREKKQKKIRVFIDGMSGFRRSMPYSERFASFLPALTNELRNLGATTIFSEETDLFSSEVVVQNRELVSTVDNVLFLRYVELRSQLFRFISIMKIRESGYDPSLREFTISDKGIEISNSLTSAEAILTGQGKFVPPMGTGENGSESSK